MRPLVERMISPAELEFRCQISPELQNQVSLHRQEIDKIMTGNDKRRLVVVGPCSIHDVVAAVDYGERLAELQKELPNLLLCMRVYFEKPRTTVGWKGLINDPFLDGSFEINHGLGIARTLCRKLLRMGLPLATEVLDPFTIKYLSGIFSWVAIGARTTESQTHREIASGLPMTVGFKNGTNGSVKVATDAMQSAAFPHHYMGMDQNGVVGIVSALGNKSTHIVLRGGSEGTNYDKESVFDAISQAQKAGVNQYLMVDCSHANAQGSFLNQVAVCAEAAELANVRGIMLESNLKQGNQKISTDLEYGVSITDACIDWETTEMVLRNLNNKG
ncbi:hypothetical protein pzkkv8_52 [Klebsiella phage pzk-kv8]|nr:hypothetical protein pzkkv8_52 [Klebsiella phage pzk-kv8]